MKNRLNFSKYCFALAIVGSVYATSIFADGSVRWKKPNVGDTQTSAPSAVAPAVFNETKKISAKNESSQIQQVRYVLQERGKTPMPDGSAPSDTAIIDTNYPETRPQTRTQPIAPPTTNESLLDGVSDFSSGYGDTESQSDSTSSTGYKPEKVVIKCPENGIFKPLTEIGYDIRLPDKHVLPKECKLEDDETYQPRDWQRICFLWKASALCHKPLYFEEEALERYGHTHVREELQPIISAGKFFLTIPVLPYKMGINPPCECIYTLGHYRPGDCAPYMLDPLPLSVRAGLIEAAVIVGGVAIIP